MLRLPEFKYFSPSSVDQVSSLLSLHNGDAKVVAGGTDLLVRMKRREMKPNYLIGLQNIPDLDYIRYNEPDGLKIGPLTTHNSIMNSSLIREKFSLLAETMGKMATPEVRNIGTIAGNLCNAAPSADSAPPLIVLGAKVKLTSTKGEKIVLLEDFFLGPGENVLQKGELLTEIQIPNLTAGTGAAYLKLSRTTVDLAVVGVAVSVTLQGKICSDVKIALGAVAPTPMRAKRAEEIIKGNKITEELMEEASLTASEECLPISDIRASAEYRKEIVPVFTKRGIGKAFERAEQVSNH